MKCVVLSAEWSPKPNFRLGPKDIDGQLSYLGSQVWRNPQLSVGEKPIPEIGPTECLIEVKACGICGSDVHMAQRIRTATRGIPASPRSGDARPRDGRVVVEARKGL